MLALSLWTPSHLLAAGGNNGGSGGAGGGAIWAGVQFSQPPGGGGSDGSGCTWQPAETYDSGIGVTGNITKTVDGVLYRLYARTCPSGTTLVWVAQLTPEELAVQAADAIYQRLPPPQGSSAPPVDRGVVNVGMWFWAEPSSWLPVSITAWVMTPTGVLSATTTATPVRLVYLPGDGSPVATCAGPGQAWSANIGDEAISPCMHTYEHASATAGGGTFDAELGIDWNISWTSSAGQGGQLPGWRTVSQYPVRVDEIQALVTS